VYYLKEKNKKALADCKKSLSIDPDNNNAKALLAKLQELPPPKEPEWFTPTFETDFTHAVGLGADMNFDSLILQAYFRNLYFDINTDVLPPFFMNNENWWGLDFEIGGAVPYNKYLLFPIGVGFKMITGGTEDNPDDFGGVYSLTLSTGVMLKIWHIYIAGRYKFAMINFHNYKYNNNFEFILGYTF
jgi:hypothetical protein